MTFEEECVADEKVSSCQLVRASASCSSSTMHLSTYVSSLLDVWHSRVPERTKQQSYIAHRTNQGIKRQNTPPHMNYLGYTITPQQTHALIDHLTHLNDCYKAPLQKQQTHAMFTTSSNTKERNLQPALSSEVEQWREPIKEKIHKKTN